MNHLTRSAAEDHRKEVEELHRKILEREKEAQVQRQEIRKFQEQILISLNSLTNNVAELQKQVADLHAKMDSSNTKTQAAPETKLVIFFFYLASKRKEEIEKKIFDKVSVFTGKKKKKSKKT